MNTKRKIVYTKYKELIDFVYNLTAQKEYTDGFSRFKDTSLSNVVTELVKRGVLKKTQYSLGAGRGRYYGFKWNVAQSPNNTFVKSVADKIRDDMNERQKRERSARKCGTPATLPHDDSEIILPVEIEIEKEEKAHPNGPSSIDSLSEQELWDILKSRGAVIRNNRLVIVREFELE